MKNWSTQMTQRGVNGWMVEGDWVMTAPTGFVKIAKIARVSGMTPEQARANLAAIQRLPRMVELLTKLADGDLSLEFLSTLRSEAMHILNREIDDRDEIEWVGRERWDKETGRMIFVVAKETCGGYLIKDPAEGHVPATHDWLATETEQVMWQSRQRIIKKTGARIMVIDDVVDRTRPMRSIHQVLNMDNLSDGFATMTHAELLSDTEEPPK